MVKPVLTCQVRPALPERLRVLEEIAYNLRWSWDHATIALFRRLDGDLWERSGHNPIRMLGEISQERLLVVAEDEAFLAHMDRVKRDLDEYVSGVGTWHRKTFGPADQPLVAYFSMEFGLTECLPIYSGGLGVLAGDHLKSASDLGVPLVGVGLLYQKGYFRQYLTADGWQQERYPVNDFHLMPVQEELDASDKPVHVSVDLAGRETKIKLWRVQVGRVRLVLLDTNIPENPQDLQDVTDELYGGDLETRIRQEIVLGIGGVRALEALGLRPRTYHMNEGHCAFQGVERIRRLVRERGLSFGEARELVAASSIFTTHTPVAAGFDVFPPDLMERYFRGWTAGSGITRDEAFALGRIWPGEVNAGFNMAVLAIRTAGYVNAVSRLHGDVSRRMFRDLWPGTPDDELPIGYVTNGVHPGSWISDDMRSLYDRYLGPRWAEEPGDTMVWLRGVEIPGEELWRTHERRRERLVGFARRRVAAQLKARGAGAASVAQAAELLDPEALTIGFGRRFATYKRATLILSDPERLAKILNAPGRPVQIIFAGKAHPKDDQGKTLIREIVQLAARPEFRRRIVFLEDYDAVVARYMLQGVDVWLNTPRRPMEASGTSGMKAAFNGALNLSVLDGWWEEGWTPTTGWAIGRGEEYADAAEQDRVEAGQLYELLEREVSPLFYDRGADGLPRRWIDLMKNAMTALCPVFNTNRMVHQYTVEGYHPAGKRRERLEADEGLRAKALAAWRAKARAAWPQVHVAKVEAPVSDELRVGDTVPVRALVRLGPLAPEDVTVEVYAGRVDEAGQIVGAKTWEMKATGATEGDGTEFRAAVSCPMSGRIGLTVRVLAQHEDLAHAHDTGLIVWS